MENTIKPQKRISQIIAEFLFMLYMITLYLFVDKEETVMISKVVFILFAAFSIISVLRSKSVHIGKNVMTVYICFTWMFATVFWAQNTHNATYMSKTLWQLFIQFFLTYNLFVEQPDSHEQLLRSLYVAGIALLGYSIYVYGIADVINKLSTENYVRLGAEINQENSFGMMNATTVIVAFYYLLYKRKFKIFHIIIAAVSFLFAMSSGSRKAFLMIFIGASFLVLKKYKLKYAYKTIVVGLVLMILLVLVIKLPMFDFINSRMESMIAMVTSEEGVDASAKLRWRMITDGWNAFKENFLIGYGANNYRNVARFKSYAHNNFIEILVDFGLIGFVLYYMIYFMAFKNLWKAKHDAGKALFSIFAVRFLMETALVTYYSKVQWVVMAFFLINVSDVINKKKVPTDEEVPEEPDSSPAEDTAGEKTKFLK